MRMKLKNPFWILAIVAVCIGISAITGSLGFTSMKSASRIGYVGNETRNTWWGKYMSLNGTMQKTMQPEGDSLVIEVETDDGSIGIKVTDSSGRYIFDETDLAGGVFTIPVSGRVQVLITADHHQGSFSIHG